MTSNNSRIAYVGRPGSGKTRMLLGVFHDAVREGREDDVLLIVPDSTAREHVRDILAIYPPEKTPGVFSDTGIHSLGSLVRSLGGMPSAGPAHCRALITKCINEGVLDYGKSKILLTPGGQAALAKSVLDLRRIGHSSLTISELKNSVLFSAMKLWEKWLGNNGKADMQDVLKSACDAALKCEWDIILIDGFTEIQPLEWRIIEALIGNASISMTAIDPDQHPSGELLDKFREIGFVEKEPESGSRWSERGDIGWLSDVSSWDIHAEPPSSFSKEKKKDRIRIISANDPRTEAAVLAREVTKCIADGCKYSDIAIMAPNLGRFRATLATEFQRAGIPLRFYVDEPLIETCCGSALDALLSVMSGDWSDESVCALIANPVFGIPSDEIKKAVVQTKSKWRLGSRKSWLDWAGSETRVFLNEIDKLSFHDEKNAIEFTEGILKLAGERIRPGWVNLPDELIASEAWAWEKTRSTLMESARVLNDIDARLDSRGIAEFLLSELRRVRSRPLDRSRDCVNAVTLPGARTWGVPVAMVAGLAREYFPHRQTPNPFLPDHIRENLDPPLPTYDELQERRKAEFRIAVTRARDRLILTCPVHDSKGSPLLPSGPLEKMIEWICGDDDPDPVEHVPPVDPDDAVYASDIAAIALENGIDDPDLAKVLLTEYGHPIEDVLTHSHYESIRFSDSDVLVHGACGSPEHPISPTDLNHLAQCPYRFFAKRILGLRESDRDRVSDGFSALLWGTIAHDALAKWFLGETQDDFESLVRVAVRKHRLIVPGSLTEARIAQIVDALRRFEEFERDYVKPVGYEQKYAELVFDSEDRRRKRHGGEGYDPVEFEINSDLKIILGGRIDRVDVKNGDVALVADYKSSTGASVSDLKEVRDFQLACYIALVKYGLGLDIAVACFFPLKIIAIKGAGKVIFDPELSSGFDDKYFRRDSDLEIEKHLDNARVVIADLVNRLSRGDINPNPVSRIKCGIKCPYRDLCRFRFTGDEGYGEGGEDDGD